ncbi:uncharacterized PE-PGRS family protein PE_PGRS54-like [Eucalyptus grandis]|uniref:uncharacterized PE-PGRS family protein PE_PGRS54-like n=1 Tax=Eucalyptus grandis TaxID=71139 RepID=UPI00192EAAF6|nr:uncharacterized PE-PGRS family protein PE_PGRS54-like [Eucalyptus grandis]
MVKENYLIWIRAKISRTVVRVGVGLWRLQGHSSFGQAHHGLCGGCSGAAAQEGGLVDSAEQRAGRGRGRSSSAQLGPGEDGGGAVTGGAACGRLGGGAVSGGGAGAVTNEQGWIAGRRRRRRGWRCQVAGINGPAAVGWRGGTTGGEGGAGCGRRARFAGRRVVAGQRRLQAEAGGRDEGERRQQRRRRERRALRVKASRSWVVGLRPATGEWGSGAVTSCRGMEDAEADRKPRVVTATAGATNGGASSWVVLAQGMAGRVAVIGGAAGRSFAARRTGEERKPWKSGAKNFWRR